MSFLMLFVELALIRWTGSNVIYLSYFSNFILLGSFLGIGVGFLRSRARTKLFPWAPVALAFFVAFILEAQVQIDRSSTTQILYFGRFAKTGLPIWLILPIIFAAVAAIMAMIAEGVARTFARFSPLDAYRLDILGSLAGITAFSLLSFTGAPPLAWGIVAGVVFLVLLAPDLRLIQVASLVALCIVLGRETFTGGLTWSPYYKIDTFQSKNGDVAINVNGVPHQVMSSVAHLRQAGAAYFVPYERMGSHPLNDVLIVGAGSGNDVAIALSEGARHVDAVEIDPRILAIGRQRHPNRPYSDPRVEVHITDGRAFLERTTRRYDLILFALPDSITLVSGQSSLRLESYLFTLEALQEARAHLKPAGVFAMYNYYRTNWLVDRYGRTLELAFHHPPCLDSVGHFGKFAVLTTGLDRGDVRCRVTWRPTGDVPQPATDNHPFPYLKTPSLPPFYVIVIGLILLTSIAAVRLFGGPFGRMRGYVDLFFMGAAFLLLETKSIVQYALLFGTTWFVNALVFAGILLSVLAAIEVARRLRPRRPQWLYGALIVALGVAWVVPLDSLLRQAFLTRFVLATLLSFTPIFLANLVFAERFRDVGSSTTAFGANLLGAMVGGLLEYSALVTGYRDLLLLIAVLYGLAFLTGRGLLAGRRATDDVTAGDRIKDRSGLSGLMKWESGAPRLADGWRNASPLVAAPVPRFDCVLLRTRFQ